jgi:hypothetical protein
VRASAGCDDASRTPEGPTFRRGRRSCAVQEGVHPLPAELATDAAFLEAAERPAVVLAHRAVDVDVGVACLELSRHALGAVEIGRPDRRAQAHFRIVRRAQRRMIPLGRRARAPHTRRGAAGALGHEPRDAERAMLAAFAAATCPPPSTSTIIAPHGAPSPFG